jgi:hypothetical protein
MELHSISTSIREYRSAAMVFCCGLFLASCSVSTRISPTQRSGIEQQLLTRSLERAFEQLDTARFRGKSAALEVYGLTDDRRFAEALLAADLQESGLKLEENSENADLRLKVFLTAFGIDRGETLLGVPGFSAPVVNLPVPEIALFKSERNRGYTQLRLFAFDEVSQKLLQKSELVEGRSKYDHYKVLLLINFTLDDVDRE